MKITKEMLVFGQKMQKSLDLRDSGTIINSTYFFVVSKTKKYS